MINEFEVRQQLAAFLDDRLSLDDFEDWLVAQSWNMHRDSMDEAQRLVSDIELALAEYSNGHSSDVVLRTELIRILNHAFATEDLDTAATTAPRKLVTGRAFSSHRVLQFQA